MISKSQAKFIKSLQLKKYRKQEQCFVVDGVKGVGEVLRSDFSIELLAMTDSYRSTHERELSSVKAPVVIVSDKQLAELSSFQTNESVIAVVKQKPNRIPLLNEKDFALVLDDIRDPGNLGSIIRSADWFGIRKIFASEQTTDFYNPKVISATMGSFTRVQFGYTNLVEQVSKLKVPTYGTYMSGEDIHSVVFEEQGLIVIGNEASGISAPLQELVTHKITIPGVQGAESLNAAVATGIVLDNWYRLKK